MEDAKQKLQQCHITLGEILTQLDSDPEATIAELAVACRGSRHTFWILCPRVRADLRIDLASYP